MKILQRQIRSSDLTRVAIFFSNMLIYFSIISYFVGWIYINEYLSHFGLYASNLDIPFYYIFVYSASPFLDMVYNPTSNDGVRLFGLIIFFIICTTVYRISRVYGYIVVLIYFLIILYGSFTVALEKSQKHAQFILNGGGKKITFLFTADIVNAYGDKIESNLLSANKQGNLRLIWRTDSDTYVVDVCNPDIPTYRIPVTSFVFSQVVGNTS